MTYRARVVNAKAAIDAGALVLHVGCGDGHLDPYLCTRFARAVGVDINYLELQGASTANREQIVEYVLIDGLVLPFQSACFDQVVSIDVLEHAEDDVALLREMSRVMKRGGQLTLTVPNAHYPLTFDPVNYLLESILGQHVSIGMWGFGHRRLYSVESLCDLLREGGFAVNQVTRVSYSLVGFVENSYLLNLVQPFTKSSAANLPLGVDANSRATWRKLSTLEPPGALKALRDLGIRVDAALFEGSASSINLLVRAQKT